MYKNHPTRISALGTASRVGSWQQYGADQIRVFNALRAKLAALKTAFEDGVMDATTHAAKREAAAGACVKEAVASLKQHTSMLETEAAARDAEEKLSKLKRAHEAGALSADELAARVDQVRPRRRMLTTEFGSLSQKFG